MKKLLPLILALTVVLLSCRKNETLPAFSCEQEIDEPITIKIGANGSSFQGGGYRLEVQTVRNRRY